MEFLFRKEGNRYGKREKSGTDHRNGCGLYPMVYRRGEKGRIGGYIAMLSSLIIPIVSNIIVTKEQKKASRVANMQAINELDDYRYFAKKEDISNLQKLDSNEIFKKFIK